MLEPLRALPQNPAEISFPVKNGDDLKSFRFGQVNDRVVGVTCKYPETERAIRKVPAQMAAQRRFRQKRARIVDRLFNMVGSINATFRDIRPDFENVSFGKR